MPSFRARGSTGGEAIVSLVGGTGTNWCNSPERAVFALYPVPYRAAMSNARHC